MRVRPAVCAVAIAVLPVVACADEEPIDDANLAPTTLPGVEQTEQPGVGEEGQGGAAQENLANQLGQQVQLTGEVAEILSPQAFTLGGDEIGENPVLVVGANVPANLQQGDQLQVSGTVKQFSVVGYEEDLDLDLVDQEFEDFDGDPAIQANSVTKV